MMILSFTPRRDIPVLPCLKRTVILLLLGLVPTALDTAIAQTPNTRYAEWINIGFGTIKPRGSRWAIPVDANLSYNFQPGHRAYHVSIEYAGDFPIMGGDPIYYTVALNTGMGKRQVGKYHMLAQFIGPALTYNKKTRGDEVSRSVSPGLAANLQFYIKPLAFIIPEIGVGIDLFGNLNVSRSFYGVRFALMMNNTR